MAPGLEGALDKVGRLQASLAEADRGRSRFAALHEEQALVSCAAHCCAIDGREIDDRRLFDVACGIAAPASLEEQEALGVFEAMQDILVRHASMDVSPAAILALHRIMEGHARPEQAGRFKRRPNSLARDWPGQEEMARVETLAPGEVPQALDALCQAWKRASARRDVDRVMLAGFTVADFLVIAPFARRNGRMSRLLTMLLLCKAGHAPVVCALTSVVMKKCREVYAGALTAACGVWRQGWSYPMLFAGAMLEMLGDAYAAFNDMRRMLDGVVAPLARAIKAMFDGLGEAGMALAYAFLQAGGRFTTADAARACPELDRRTLLKLLKELEAQGLVVRRGSGRGTSWEASSRLSRLR